MTITSTTQSGVWQTVPLTCEVCADREIWTVAYEGDYDKLQDYAGQFYVGRSATINGRENDSFYQGAIVYGRIRLSRKVGGLGILSISYIALYKLEIWNIDFQQSSKSIENWLALMFTNTEGAVSAEGYRQLMLLRAWRATETTDKKLFREFKADKETPLPSEARRVAEKILKGVTNYPWYSPVITRTTVRCFAPVVGKIGFQQMPSSVTESGWRGFSEGGIPPHWESLANVFVKTAEKSHTNSDGTFTLVEQWLGMDGLDPDLYPTA